MWRVTYKSALWALRCAVCRSQLIVGLILLGMVSSEALAHTDAGSETVYGSRRIVLAGILLAGIGFTLGWVRLRKKRASRIRQLLFHLAGLSSVGLALLSPIDRYATSSFILHMIQHQLLMMLACPILLLTDPLPAYLWGLPEVLRKRFGHLLVRRAPLRRLFETVTLPSVAWTLYVANLWFWHYPAIYDAALRIPWLHDLEHVAFFTTGILFWWPVIRPAPHFHATPSYVLRIFYLVLALIQNGLLSGLILLSPVVLYPHYETVAPLWDLSPMQDQLWGGFIMWSSGSMMYLLAVMVLLIGMLDTEGKARVSRGHRSEGTLQGVADA